MRYKDAEKLEFHGGAEWLDLNFWIEVTRDKFYTPIQIAAANGGTDCLEVLLKNPSRNIDELEREAGVNAFWLAAYFG